MTDNRTTELLPCPICGKKVYIGLYDDGHGYYWWMVHGGMHYDECHCRLFMESCKFELEDETRVDHDEHATGIRGGLAKRWNVRAEQAIDATLGSDELPYEKLLHCLENDWHIRASWDGLRKLWCIELTEEGVRMRDATHGTLTAEQVRECVQSVYMEGYNDGSVNRGAHIDETDWQAIADELNAEIAGRKVTP